MKNIRVGVLITAMAIPIVTGMVSAAISSKGMAMYGAMEKPPLSPPAWLFPIAWTILYLMMGLASYYILISKSDSGHTLSLLFWYAIQLMMNFFWSIIFFNWQMYLLAFFWLVIMWVIVVSCTYSFYQVSKPAGYLFVPYVLWLTFAGYLNLGAYILDV